MHHANWQSNKPDSNAYILLGPCTLIYWVFNSPLNEFNLSDDNCFLKLLLKYRIDFSNWCLIEGWSKDLSWTAEKSWKSLPLDPLGLSFAVWLLLPLFIPPCSSCLLSLWWAPPMWRSGALRHIQKLWNGFSAALQSFHRRQLEWHNEGNSTSAVWYHEDTHALTACSQKRIHSAETREKFSFADDYKSLMSFIFHLAITVSNSL